MYKTLAELVTAYKTGDITAPLMLDNDQASVMEGLDDDPLSWRTTFEMHPEELLEQALDLLGIPHEHV